MTVEPIVDREAGTVGLALRVGPVAVAVSVGWVPLIQRLAPTRR